MRCSRSDESPTSSGFMTGEDAMTAASDVTDSADATSTRFMAASWRR
jgi:hypothetical protein